VHVNFGHFPEDASATRGAPVHASYRFCIVISLETFALCQKHHLPYGQKRQRAKCAKRGTRQKAAEPSTLAKIVF
jgi:hypothetical protein